MPNKTKCAARPLGVAALLTLLVLTGCGAQDDDITTIASEAKPEASASASVSPSEKADDGTAVDGDEETGTDGAADKAFNSGIEPADVEIPKDVAAAYGEANTKTLASSAAGFVSLIDGQAELQRPGADLAKIEPAFRSAVKPSMDPDAYASLWKAITSKDGTHIVAMWTGDASVEVDGATYMLADAPWTFNYGEPLVEDVPEASVPSVRYSQVVNYLVPVTAEDGAEKRLVTRVTRSYTLQPGPHEGWIVNGIWASEPTPYKVLEVTR